MSTKEKTPAAKKTTPKKTETTPAVKKQSPMELLQASNEEAISIAKEDLDSLFDNDYLKQVSEQYGSFEITSIKDVKGYKSMKDQLKRLKSVRIDTDARRKELTAPALKFQKELKSHADEYIEQSQLTEKMLAGKIQTFEDLEAAEKNKLVVERSKDLLENGYDLIGKMYVCGINQVDAESLSELTEDDMSHYIDMGQKELKRREIEFERQKKEEEQRQQDIKDLEERRAKIQKDEKEHQEFLAWKESQKKPAETPVEKPIETAKETTEKPTENQPEKTTEKPTSSPSETSPSEKMTKAKAGYDLALNDIFDFVNDKSIKLDRKVIFDKIKTLRFYKSEEQKTKISNNREQIIS